MDVSRLWEDPNFFVSKRSRSTESARYWHGAEESGGDRKVKPFVQLLRVMEQLSYMS